MKLQKPLQQWWKKHHPKLRTGAAAGAGPEAADEKGTKLGAAATANNSETAGDRRSHPQTPTNSNNDNHGCDPPDIASFPTPVITIVESDEGDDSVSTIGSADVFVQKTPKKYTQPLSVIRSQRIAVLRENPHNAATPGTTKNDGDKEEKEVSVDNKPVESKTPAAGEKKKDASVDKPISGKPAATTIRYRKTASEEKNVSIDKDEDDDDSELPLAIRRSRARRRSRRTSGQENDVSSSHKHEPRTSSASRTSQRSAARKVVVEPEVPAEKTDVADEKSPNETKAAPTITTTAGSGDEKDAADDKTPNQTRKPGNTDADNETDPVVRSLFPSSSIPVAKPEDETDDVLVPTKEENTEAEAAYVCNSNENAAIAANPKEKMIDGVPTKDKDTTDDRTPNKSIGQAPIAKTDQDPTVALEAMFAKFDVDEGQLDLSRDNFQLDERTDELFSNLARLLECKKNLDGLYRDWIRSSNRVLSLREFESFGPPSRLEQDGGPRMSLEEVRQSAETHKPQFDRLLRKLVQHVGLDPDRVVLVGGKPIRNGTKTKFRILTLVDLKAERRCIEKMHNEYDGNAKYLCDVGRATIVCREEAELAKVVRALQKSKSIDVVRMKNRFENPIYTGVRDIMVNVKVRGHIFEIQIHQAALLAENTKSNAHTYYEFFRKYFSGATDTYKNRMELFDELGDTVRLEYHVSDGVRAILEGTDKTKLRLLNKIASEQIFDDSKLQLIALKRLWAISQSECAAGRLQLMGDVAGTYNRRGNYSKATEIYAEVIKGQKLVLIHPDILGSMHALAKLQMRQGNFQNALESFEEVLRHRVLVLGGEHRDTLTTNYEIACVHTKQRNYDSAMKVLKETLQGQKLILGNDHPETLGTINGIALIHFKQGDHQSAIKGYKEALNGSKSRLGEDHPSTLSIMNNLAGVYRDQNNYDAAIKLYKEVTQRKKQVIGADHPDTLTTLNNLASALSEHGNHKAAINVYKAVIERRKQVLSEDHPSTLTSMSNLADALMKQGSHKAALEIIETIAGYQKLKYGADHKETLTTMSFLAYNHSEQGNHQAAIEIYEDVVTCKQTVLGKDDPSTLLSRRNLEMARRKQTVHGKLSTTISEEVPEKQDSNQVASESNENVAAPKTPKNAVDDQSKLTTMEYLAYVNTSQKRIEVVQDRKPKVDEDQQPNANASSDEEQENHHNTLDNYSEVVIQHQKLTLGANHPETMASMQNLAFKKLKQGNHQAALELYQEMVKHQKEVLGLDHPDTLSTMRSLAFAHSALGNHDTALEIHNELGRRRTIRPSGAAPHRSQPSTKRYSKNASSPNTTPPTDNRTVTRTKRK